MALKKQRHRRACERAKVLLESPPASYNVFLVKHPVFDVMAWKGGEVQAIRVAVDRISPEDISLVREQDFPNGTVKKILKKKRGEREFEERIIN